LPFFRRRAARPALRWLLPAALVVCLAGAGAQPAAEYNKLGIEAFEAGRYGDAVGYFEKALDKARGNETLRRNLCNARQGRAQELAAAEDFRGAIVENGGTSFYFKMTGPQVEVDPLEDAFEEMILSLRGA